MKNSPYWKTYLGEHGAHRQHLQLATGLVELYRQLFHSANVLILRHTVRHQNLLQRRQLRWQAYQKNDQRTLSSPEWKILSTASPLRTPCVTRAYTFVAPSRLSNLAARVIVFDVSAKSSTRIQIFSFTWPTKSNVLVLFREPFSRNSSCGRDELCTLLSYICALVNVTKFRHCFR